MKQFKVEVIADNTGQWYGNGRTFATEIEAHDYGRELAGRWFAVRDFRVVAIEETKP